MVEDRLIGLARAGQLSQRVTEGQVKEILAGVARQEGERGEGEMRVRMVRRGGWEEEDDEGLEELMGV